VIKDLEDVKGDTVASCQTFVVRYGNKAGKILALVLGVLLIAALYTWDLKHSGSTLRLIFTVLQGAVVASMAFVWWAADNKYFHNASLLVKAVMLAGTSMLLMI
jgi:4-hydroxybenzoate polyprenyltransferase